jgi:ribosome maturation factor RimP
MNPADEDKLRELAQTVAAGAGYDLEELVIVAAGRRRLIRVVVDGDHGLSLDAAAEVSRALGAALDAEGDAYIGPEPYTLEVTSPGVGRPLTEKRHFRRARGRLISVKLFDGSTVEGRVRRVAGDVLELLTGTDVTTAGVPLSDIRRAKVDVEFAKMPAAHAALLASDGFVDPARASDDIDSESENESNHDFFDGANLEPDDFDDEQDPHVIDDTDSTDEEDDNDKEAAHLEPADQRAPFGRAREGQQ